MWDGLADLEPDNDGPVWEDPIPLKRSRELPLFPTGTLPGWLRAFVEAVAEETQTPVDLAACIALSVLATAAGGRAVVHVRGNWREPTNLFVVVALPPANRKSAVFAALTEPLFEAEELLKATVQPAIVEAQLTARLAKEAADRAAAKAAGAEGGKRDELIAAAVGMAQTADAVTVPVEPQLLADDATAETVTSRMAEQGGRISVMSAEGEIFDIIAGRYSGKPNMGVFLKGHAGDRLRVDRQTRKEYIDHPALTMGLSVQPKVLDDIGKVAGFKGRGLLGRFLYSLPKSLVGEREVITDPVPDEVTAAYTRNVIDLTLSLAEWTDPAVIQLSADADAALIEFQRRIEPKLAARGGSLGHISDWAGKLAGATARMAALLHLAEHLQGGHARPVAVATMQAAITIGEYFTAHALAVFDAMGIDPAISRARSLLEVLEANEWTEVSRRDLFAKLSRAEFPTVADLEPAVALLEEHGYLRAYLPERTGARGRPPAPRYLLHPALSKPAA
ncbi:YfjI family protein [Streptomyces sp. H10-C2]|uniref:YfjI family protein n=1 Tax=unclassified Streptomyces TaxID=2593676 RepID=UPI0024BBB431|nr:MULTISPECIES: YfjI family protein [unclassified Streptomyces]MDJ0341382.1 YfjI family protein [Streptomyces sp. PH10-H1]MDJ0370977.1 YfjI family protein [Streptomyces sp. H10-C2]